MEMQVSRTLTLGLHAYSPGGEGGGISPWNRMLTEPGLYTVQTTGLENLRVSLAFNTIDELLFKSPD